MAAKRRKRSSAEPGEIEVDLARLLVALANMHDDGGGHFRRSWPLYARYSIRDLLRRRDELRLLWPRPVDDAPVNLDAAPDLDAWTEAERDYVESGGGLSRGQFVCNSWLHDAGRETLLVDWDARRLRPNPRCLPLVLLWGCLRQAEHLVYCGNPECPAPYFIATRKDQRYCSDDCAAPAKRQAKLKWWNENRAGVAAVRDPGRL
jgi:hypothetical protein